MYAATTQSGVLGNSGIHFDLSEGQLSKLETCWGHLPEKKKCLGHSRFLILVMIIGENIGKGYH